MGVSRFVSRETSSRVGSADTHPRWAPATSTCGRCGQPIPGTVPSGILILALYSHRHRDTPLRRSTRISTTVVASSTKAPPYVLITAPCDETRAMICLAASTSPATERPFIATTDPPWRHRREHHGMRRFKGATARDVTTSNDAASPTSSARARTTRTRSSKPNIATASDKKEARRKRGSIRTIFRSGRRIAHTRPGRPAPEPTSATRAPSPAASLATAQLRRCRSQILLDSRGPISPRSTPGPHSSEANSIASGSSSENTSTASGGGGGVSRETSRSLTGTESPRRDAQAPRPPTRS